MTNQSWEPQTAEELLENIEREVKRIGSLQMNYRQIGMYKRPMNLFDKLSYGIYWFGVCWEEWYDTVMLGYYDEDELPSWEFFNHINCNYPLDYRMMK